MRDVNHAEIHSVNIKKKKKTVPRALLNSYKVTINKEVLFFHDDIPYLF